ncbi:MAG: phospholipid carrier-dependent glycosyltransferase [Pseudomonadota bacterium]
MAGKFAGYGGRLGLVLLCTVLMLVFALFGPVDHDEGQYVGAVAMMRHGLPYRDFAYLQTPLQPLLFAPLAWIAEGWLFLTLRVTNALLATGATACMWLAAKRAGASDRGVVIAAIALFSSHALLFAGSVARNDALPLLLTTAGLAAFLNVVGNNQRHWRALLAGVLLGAAASAKISYGLPAAAVGLFAVLHWRSLGARAVCALAVGGALGGLPTLWLALLAPDAAWFGIMDYSLKAPIEWRTLNGQAFMFDWPLSLARLLRYLAQGCGLIALVAVLLVATRRRTVTERLLDMVIVAGLLAAWLPRPIYVQYLGPLLPALFVRFALLTDASFWRAHFLGRALIAVGVIAGVAQSVIATGPNIWGQTSPVLAITDDAHALSDIAAAARISGTITTLSPERAVDASLTIDRHFVTGPFLMRTRHVLTADQARAFQATTSATLVADLNTTRPAAILVGGEAQPSAAYPHGLDAPLVDWARSNRYRAVALPSGLSRVFLRSTKTDE